MHLLKISSASNCHSLGRTNKSIPFIRTRTTLCSEKSAKVLESSDLLSLIRCVAAAGILIFSLAGLNQEQRSFAQEDSPARGLTSSAVRTDLQHGGSESSTPITVTPLNFGGMPVKIIRANAENLIVSSRLDWTAFNSAEDISQINIRIYVVSSRGEVIKSEDCNVNLKIMFGTERTFNSLLGINLEPNEQPFVAITKAQGKKGIWYVSSSKLEEAVKSRVTHQHDVDIPVNYEPHIKMRDDDKTNILRLAVLKIVHDKWKSELLNGKGRIFILKENIDFDLPQIADATISAISFQELEKVAVREKRILFLSCEPFVIEGSRVKARITLRDRSAPTNPAVSIPFKFSYSFTCINQSGRWVIEDYVAYS
jgi:hypothetical protein